MNTLVLTILFAVCFSIANSQEPQGFTNFQKPCGYFVPKTFTGAVVEAGIQVGASFAGVGANVTQLTLLCTDAFLPLWNLNLTDALASLNGKISLKAALIARNTDWCGITDDTARVVDKLQVKAESSLAMSHCMRIREISRGAMYSKILTTTGDELALTLEIDNYYAAKGFKSYVSSAFSSITGNTCVALLPAITGFLVGAATNPLTPVLLGTKGRAIVIGQISANVTAQAFAALYTRKTALLASGDALAAIAADLIVDARAHLFGKVNRTVHKLADFVKCFGEDAGAVAGSVRYNVVKRLQDLVDDAFDRVREVDDVTEILITKTVGTLNASGYYTFDVTVNCVNNTNFTAVGEKLVAFLKGFIEAYSHPASITVVSSARVGTSLGWKAVVRAFAALDVEFDPRDLTGDRPKLDVTPDNTPDNTSNTEYKDCVENYNVKPADVPNATAQIDAALAAQATALANAKAELAANISAYLALVSYDFNALDTQIKNYSAEVFNLVNLRVKAALAATEVKKAHLQLAAKVKADLAAQVVAARNCEILSINLKLQLIASIAALNATNRTGCDNIPDWKLETTTTDDCYNMTQVPACRTVAGIIAQLLILKKQLLTAVSVKSAINAKIQTLNDAVAKLDADFKAYAAAITTTGFAAKKSTADCVAVVTNVAFKARIEACVKTVANGILKTCTYVQASASAGVYTHTINAEFNADVALSTDVLNSRLQAALQLCVSIHVGGDLSYFKAKPTSTVTKRGLLQQSNSQVTSDFNDNSTSTTGSASTSGASTSTTGSASTSLPVSTTTGAGAITFSVVIAFASMIVAMFL